MSAVLAQQAQSQGPKARRVKPGSPEETGSAPATSTTAVQPSNSMAQSQPQIPAQAPIASISSVATSRVGSRFGFPSATSGSSTKVNPFSAVEPATSTHSNSVRQQPVDSQISPMKAARRALNSGLAPSSDSAISSICSDDSRSIGKSLRPRAVKSGPSSHLPGSDDAQPPSSDASQAPISSRRSRAVRVTSNPTMASDSNVGLVPSSSTQDSAPAPPLSSAEISKLTARHTRRNEVYLAKLDVRPVYLEGKRPPSPSSKIRRSESSDEKKKARSQRAKKRNGLSDEESSSSDVDESEEDGESGGDATDDDESKSLIGMTEFFNRHTKGAGEDERFETPTKLKSGNRKGVRWHKSLFTGPNEAPSDSTAQADVKPAMARIDLKRNRPRKSCVKRVSQNCIVAFSLIASLTSFPSFSLFISCSSSLSIDMEIYWKCLSRFHLDSRKPKS